MTERIMNNCERRGLNGKLCGKRCYFKICSRHRNAINHTLCLNECGRGTRSLSGYCNKCSSKQQLFSNKRYLTKKKSKLIPENIPENISETIEIIPENISENVLDILCVSNI